MANILINKEDFKFEINSSVKSVTIFSDRAEVTRTMKANIKKGVDNITFLNLGTNIDSNTIRAQVFKNNIKIVSNSIESNILYFFKEKENQKIFEEIITELKNFIKLEDEKFVSLLENSIIFDLRDYIQLSMNELILDSDNSLTKLKEALTFLEQKINENSNSIITLNGSLDALKEKLDIYKMKLDKIRSMDKRVQNNIVVTVESPEDCKIEVEVSYTLTGVSWRSTYDASLDTENSVVSLSYYGEVAQSTGEDWIDCRFILSTAIIDREIEIPKIYPYELSGYSEKRDKSIKVQEEVYKELEEEDEELGGKPEPDLDQNKDIRVSSAKKGASHSFVVEKPATIISDGLYHKLPIVNTDFKAELFYETVPELMEYVYQKASVENSLPIPFLPGTVMIYRSKSYMGRSQLKYIACGEKFALSFGIDDDVRIKRIVHINRYIEPSNVFAKKQREFKYVYALNNFKKDKISVKIKESIHKSEIKELSVEMNDDTTAGYELNTEGILTWDVLLAPDPFKPTEVVLHYTISSGKSFPLENI